MSEGCAAEDTALAENAALAANGAASDVEGRGVIEEILAVERSDLPALIECLLFVNGNPLSLERLIQVTGFEEQEVQAALLALREDLRHRKSGVELLEVSGGFQLRTRNHFAPYIRNLKLDRPRRLSPAALETLAVVAYRQPIVKSDIEAIRGVDATPTLKTLMDRRLIRIVGHQNTVGLPALYGSTDAFLELFGLKSLAELPTLRDLKELQSAPLEEDSETVGDSTQDSMPENGTRALP